MSYKILLRVLINKIKNKEKVVLYLFEYLYLCFIN